MDREIQQPIINTRPSAKKQEENSDQVVGRKNQITLIPVQVDKNMEQYQSQFLEIDAEMMHKLQKIEQSKNKQPQRSIKSNQNSLPLIKSQQDQRQEQAMIKRQFVHKLKQWQRQRQELKIRKQEIEQRKQRQKQSQKQRNQREAQQQRQFLKLQKKKQIQQKIQQIEQRRQQREQSLKNVLLKRSYNKLPSYSQQQQRYKQDDRQQIEINIKLLKSKRKLSKIDPQELKMHQKAYIQRIKERLNMVPKRQEKAKSDFNLYLKRNQEKKEQQMKKIEKMKKYQQNINKIPIKISQYKKQQKLIQIDKIKNPQKYRLLSNKLLNDKQIFEQFKNFQININRKEISMNYLKQLKQMHDNGQKVKVRSKRSNSQIINNNYQQKLPAINKKYQHLSIKQPEKTKSVELKPTQTYRHNLQKNKAKDSQYMKALRQKLALAIDM